MHEEEDGLETEIEKEERRGLFHPSVVCFIRCRLTVSLHYWLQQSLYCFFLFFLFFGLFVSPYTHIFILFYYATLLQ